MKLNDYNQLITAHLKTIGIMRLKRSFISIHILLHRHRSTFDDKFSFLFELDADE
jgi:hypothetical protein